MNEHEGGNLIHILSYGRDYFPPASRAIPNSTALFSFLEVTTLISAID